MNIKLKENISNLNQKKFKKIDDGTNISLQLQVFPHRWTFNKQNDQIYTATCEKTDDENYVYCKTQFPCGVMASPGQKYRRHI